MASRRPPKCKAKKADGRRCTRRAVLDGLCRQHHERLSGGGREPEAIDLATAERLARLLERGVAIEQAAAAVGIPRRTIYNWLERAGEVGAPEVYVQFAERIEQARSKCEADLVETIADEAREDWRAAAWLLERLAPERFARPSVRPPASARTEQAPDRRPDEAGERPPDNVVTFPTASAHAGADW